MWLWQNKAKWKKNVVKEKSSDICTSLSYNFYDNFIFLFYDWSKTIEREKGKERIKT